jgi:hypothetical protein
MRPRSQSAQAQDEAAQQAPKAPGAFRADGSYNEEGELYDRGQIDALVRSLVRYRREERLSVIQALSAIRAANAGRAFPSIEQWEAVKSWPMVWTATAAEEMVKREGRGTNGHWCGERWMPGEAADCSDDRHRVRASQEEIGALVATLHLSLPSVSDRVVGPRDLVMQPPAGGLRLTEDQVADAHAQAAKLRSLGLHPGLHRDDAVAKAGQP